VQRRPALEGLLSGKPPLSYGEATAEVRVNPQVKPTCAYPVAETSQVSSRSHSGLHPPADHHHTGAARTADAPAGRGIRVGVATTTTTTKPVNARCAGH
jgi:hypothetical protein